MKQPRLSSSPHEARTRIVTAFEGLMSKVIPVLVLIPLLILVSACSVGNVEPATSPAQLDFGVKMAQRGLWSEALFRFRQAERHDPGNARVLNNMAVAHEALGHFEKALEYYQNAIKAAPGDRELKRNYSRFVEFYRSFRPDDQEDAALGS